MQRSGFCRGAVSAALLFCALAGCGKSDSGASAAAASSDPAAAKIVADIQTPFLFALAQGIRAEQLDSNGELLGYAAMVRAPYNPEEAKTECAPTTLHFAYMKFQNWVAARVLQQVKGTALVKQGEQYVPVAALMQPRPPSSSHGGVCLTWYFFDWGHFRVTHVKLANEFKGPDLQTQATTKIRSYEVSATFVPSATLSSVAPSAKFGTFTWTVALEQNPVTMEWTFYQFGDPPRWSL